MEHLLLRGGGEQYLPFARSRIKTLKALGTPYAGQKFEIDGVSIKVRIEPGNEHITIEGSKPVYMETGQLSWTFPGLKNPERLDPAKWHFIDIPTDAKFLGKVSAMSGKQLGKQLNRPDLTEGMNSKAVGYPHKEYPQGATDAQKAEIDAKNEATKNEYGEATVAKKVMVGYFPSSLFPGKLRLFVQAQYGAPERLDGVGMYIELLGTSAILKYHNKNGVSVQFGVYSHLSVGLFTAPDGSYWLIHIHNPHYDTYYVKAYRITLSTVANSLKPRLKDPKVSAEDKQKVEAYMLSDAVLCTEDTLDAEGNIDIQNVFEVGQFAGRSETSMAYGWKFNTAGNEAKVVVHQFQGTDNHDNRWIARTLSINITYEIDEDTKEVKFTMANSTEVHGEWTDGWGAYNMFVPNDDPPTMGVLSLWSLATNRPGVKPEFPYSNVAVYGYYKDNVWTPVTLTRTAMIEPEHRWSSEGISFLAPMGQEITNAHQYGYCPADSDCTFEEHDILDGATMTISVGDTVINGVNEFGTHHYYTRVVGDSVTVPNTVSFTSRTSSPFTAGEPPDPEGFDYTGAESVLYMTTAQITCTLTYYQGIHNRVWSLVIPTCDCEAVNVATWEYDTPDGAIQHDIISGTGLIGFSGVTADTTAPLEKGMAYSFTPWSMANAVGGWYGLTAAGYSTTPGPRAPAPKRVFCFNAAVKGQEGTPRGSYYTLFNVTTDNPFYEPGMYTLTGYGKRYEISEGLKSPASVNYQHRFVGWA